MTDIEYALNLYFKFERDVSPAYADMHERFVLLKNHFTNVKVENKALGFYGIAGHHELQSKGLVLVEYTVDKVIREKGEKLPGKLSFLSDCEKHYYGLKLNCIAMFSGRKIQSMTIRDCYNGKNIPVLYKPELATIFLREAWERIDKTKPETKPVETTVLEKDEQLIFF